MGSGRWNASDWESYTKTHIDNKPTSKVYDKTGMDKDLNPKDVIRESRDSDDNPNSTALIVALDVTGSMDAVLDSMARKGLPTMATEIYDRKPISDPHIMFMGVGDYDAGDKAPLQVTQFEADIRIADQLRKVWLERGGGGNKYEGYNLPWYFAAMKTSIDCFEKRGKKGYLFTIGDEETPRPLSKNAIQNIFGDTVQADISIEDCLEIAMRKYEVFHIIVEEGSHYRWNGRIVKEKWQKLLQQRALFLSDHTKIAELIVSTIQMVEGMDKEEVIASWNGDTSVVIRNAIGDKSLVKQATASGVVEFS